MGTYISSDGRDDYMTGRLGVVTQPYTYYMTGTFFWYPNETRIFGGETNSDSWDSSFTMLSGSRNRLVNAGVDYWPYGTECGADDTNKSELGLYANGTGSIWYETDSDDLYKGDYFRGDFGTNPNLDLVLGNGREETDRIGNQLRNAPSKNYYQNFIIARGSNTEKNMRKLGCGHKYHQKFIVDSMDKKLRFACTVCGKNMF